LPSPRLVLVEDEEDDDDFDKANEDEGLKENGTEFLFPIKAVVVVVVVVVIATAAASIEPN